MDDSLLQADEQDNSQECRTEGPAPESEKLYIRVPAQIWNSVPGRLVLRFSSHDWDSVPWQTSISTSISRTLAKRKRVTQPPAADDLFTPGSASGPELDDDAASDKPFTPRPTKTRKCRPLPKKSKKSSVRKAGHSRAPTPARCGIKISRFQYGGPERRRRGRQADVITLQQPCRGATCTDCVEWNWHLIGDEDGVEMVTGAGKETGAEKEIEGACDTWTDGREWSKSVLSASDHTSTDTKGTWR